MAKLITVEELNQIREKALSNIELRQKEQKYIPIEHKDMKSHTIHVLVCGGTGCHSSDGDKIRELLEKKK